MLNERRVGWREREVLLVRACGSDYRIMIHVKGIKLIGYTMLVVMMHWGILLIEGIFVKISVMFRIVGYHYTIDRWDMGGEVGWSFSSLRWISTYRR